MATAQENKTIESTIIELEKAALEKWNNGDPSAFLELSATDVVYFDPYLEKRINGLSELTKLYEPLKGQGFSNRFELINPLVQASEKMAVLTFNYVSYSGNTPSRWNCTEVYRCEPDGKWKIIQTHWSLTKPELK
ncbi:MAG TPA: nuclear transport factor 2 family protein [Prolixibacteraceae bacterium]|nr:nuclear transport factor 2 family protein [Prolixibacteraceae bacterium]